MVKSNKSREARVASAGPQPVQPDSVAGRDAVRAARIHLPNAVEKIAFDRFHVAKQPGEVVDKTRQNEPSGKGNSLPVAAQR
ncbi:Transposase (plasmid) [Shigella dysenteriae 1617]|uniref:Transposase n=1 Tax=Shigella dysenteriae 1617 TaxID=754093 RepID=A0A0A7A4X0_SHIDY|nr:Transposase [Shigella dysenteriae 1617]